MSKIKNISGNDRNSIVAPPSFIKVSAYPVGNHKKFDFNFSRGSDAIDAGGPLKRTSGSGSGKSVRVDDAGYFFDGYKIVAGDLIRIGSNSPVRIININYNKNILEVDGFIAWERNAPVNLQYTGTAPDIGAQNSTDVINSDPNAIKPPTGLKISFST